MEEKVKRYITQVLCILCAIGLWLYVTYVEDPETEVWIHGVPIAYVGASQLEEKNLVFLEVDMPEAVNVKIAGARSVLRRVEQEEITATVDYSEIDHAGTYMLQIRVSLPQMNIRMTKLSKSSTECVVDELVTVQKTVTVTSVGAGEVGVRDFAATPSTVTLTGAKTVLETITTSVFVDLTVDEFDDTYPVMLTDPEGKPFTGADVALGETEVELRATRALPIEIHAADVPQDKEIERTVCEPDTAEVRGTLREIMEIDKIEGAYAPWVDFGQSPAVSGEVPLAYPEKLERLGAAYAKASFYWKEK